MTAPGVPEKTRLEQLAIFGAAPAFREPLHVGRPNVPDPAAVLERLRGALETRRLTNHGPLVREFERRVAERVGVRNCVATCNATLALQVAARALGLEGEVILPSFSFVATAHAFKWLGLTPVFADLEPATHNIDPGEVERLVSPATAAIVGVHLWGRACRIEALEAVARARGLPLLFDASHAFDCTHAGRMLGGFGDAEVFSFHATKFVNSFEGGALVTNRDELAVRLRLMVNFGFEGPDRVRSLGLNAKMSEAAAAMGLAGLDSLDVFAAANRRNHLAYQTALAGLPGVRLAVSAAGERWHHHYVVLEIDQTGAGLSRDELLELLQAENVLARRYFFPGCHRMEPYRSEPAYATLSLPASEGLADRVLQLPTGTALSGEDVGRVAGLLRLAVEKAPELRARWLERRLTPTVADPGEL